jgi:hypothetical protein
MGRTKELFEKNKEENEDCINRSYDYEQCVYKEIYESDIEEP